MACSRTNQPTWIHDLVHLRVTTVGVYFDLMDGGRFRHYVKATYPPLALGETHLCRWFLDLEAGAFLVQINGVDVLRYQHPDITRLGVPYVFWEIYYDDEESTARLLIDRVLGATP